MNIKPVIELVTHSPPALKYWLLLIPVKTTGSYAFIGLTKAYLSKQARKLDFYFNKLNGYGVLKLSSNRVDKVFYLTYYFMMVGDLIQ